ncbi:flagellar biosynthetic protein FliR [Gephyromycinifex aptenodytis]|uniref:flagellar biosynthetic protein FliR n=1 Tax=Gephyromycinifex aptenodytis TaxID=2716227 RepID=UPI0014457189|nr:flagellar biosynthetic protein FliR [Gephyromycinifex aptenodytis]
MSIDVGLTPLLTFILVSVRILAFLIIAPPFSSKSVPLNVRAMIAFAVALPIFPHLVVDTVITGLPGFIGAITWQLLTGLTLGVLVLALFTAVQAAGEFVDLFSMLAMATMLDPVSNTNSSIFGRIYYLIGTTLLFATGGHLLLLRGLLTSFQIVPAGEMSLGRLAQAMGSNLDRLVISALEISGPIVAVLFLTDLALGLVSRAVPSLNIFQLSFPVKTLLTVSLATLAIAFMPAAIDTGLSQILRQFGPVTRMLGG